MTNPSQIEEFRRRHDLKPASCAKLFGVHRSQIGRWEKGEQKIPNWVGQLIDYYEKAMTDNEGRTSEGT